MVYSRFFCKNSLKRTSYGHGKHEEQIAVMQNQARTHREIIIFINQSVSVAFFRTNFSDAREHVFFFIQNL